MTTSGRYSVSLCLELTAQVDIKGEKGFFGNPDIRKRCSMLTCDFFSTCMLRKTSHVNMHIHICNMHVANVSPVCGHTSIYSQYEWSLMINTMQDCVAEWDSSASSPEAEWDSSASSPESWTQASSRSLSDEPRSDESWCLSDSADATSGTHKFLSGNTVRRSSSMRPASSSSCTHMHVQINL